MTKPWEYLIEMDKKERESERASYNDPVAYYRHAKRKLRRLPHLGQLSTKQWDLLIQGAADSGEVVYVVYPLSYARSVSHVIIIRLLGVEPGNVITASESVFFRNLTHTTWQTRSTWSVYNLRRTTLNNKMDRDARLFILKGGLSPMDVAKLIKLNELYSVLP